MAINETEVEQLFRSLGERFARVHAPGFDSLWAAVRADISSAERALMGEDITELVARLEDLSRASGPVSHALNTAGPHLIAHADTLTAAFGENFLAGAHGGGGSGMHLSGAMVGTLSWGSVLAGVSAGVGTLDHVLGRVAKLRYLSPFTEDGLKAWDTVTGLAVKLPDQIGGPILGGMKSLLFSNGAESLAGFGDTVAKFLPGIGWAAAGLQAGAAIHDVMTEGWNTQTLEGMLKAGGSVAAQFGPIGLAVDGGINLGIWGSNELWSHFPAQSMAVSNFIVGIPGDLGTAGSDAVSGVEHAWNAASDAVSSGWHDVTGVIGNIHLPWP